MHIPLLSVSADVHRWISWTDFCSSSVVTLRVFNTTTLKRACAQTFIHFNLFQKKKRSRPQVHSDWDFFRCSFCPIVFCYTNTAYLTCNRVKWCVTCVGQVQLRGYMVTYVDLWIYTTVTEQLCLADSFTSTFSIESRMTISCSLWDIINAFAMSSWKNILPIVLLLWTLSNHLYWS